MLKPERRASVLSKVAALNKGAVLQGAKNMLLRALGAPFRGAVRGGERVLFGRMNSKGPLAGTRQVMERRSRWSGRGPMPQWMADEISAGTRPGRVKGPVHGPKGELLGFAGEAPGPGGLRGLAARHPLMAGALAYGALPLPGSDMVRSLAMFPADIAKGAVIPNTELRPEVLRAFSKPVSFQNPLAAMRDNPRIPYRGWGRRNVLAEPELPGAGTGSPDAV